MLYNIQWILDIIFKDILIKFVTIYHWEKLYSYILILGNTD